MRHRIKLKEFGLDVIYRHDYDFRNKVIKKYTEGSCKFLKEFITNIPKAKEFKTFLDVGCGDTTALEYFKDEYDVEGIDLYPAIKDKRIRKINFYDLSKYIKPVDILFCNHTLEHSLAPLLLEQIKKSIKIGGVLFIAVPDADYSWAYDIKHSTTHWSIFNEGFLRSIVTRYGFECYVEKKIFRENKGELFLVGIKRV